MLDERAFNLHPLKRKCGHAVGLGQWVDKIRRARTEKTRGVRADGFTGHQPNSHLTHGGIGIDIEAAELAHASGRNLCVNSNGFRTTAFRSLGEFWREPYAIRGKFQFILP